jgi:hypothetical protein
MKCPACDKWISRKAKKCPYCQSVIYEDGLDINNYFNYINQGFYAIESECNSLDNEIEALTGSVFMQHQFSKNELLHSHRIDKINAIAGKMNDDIENWVNSSKLPIQFQTIFTRRLSMIQARLNNIIYRINGRRATFWETVLQIFMVVYKHVFNIAVEKIQDYFERKNNTGYESVRNNTAQNKTKQSAGDIFYNIFSGEEDVIKDYE